MEDGLEPAHRRDLLQRLARQRRALAKWGPPMTDLSPAADAVLDAYNSGFDRPVAVHHKPRIAAALRAAAIRWCTGNGHD
jgi:hypothetical protein